ncbi:hypothetical protein [Dongia rigui]|uniref:Uncharacterized protein n=1 Tax=Dongia rigui TaxID=940149 RepID=A0ABU5E032_9PROT|nr:hypothetical protein [Dongia rigui]MDY0872818.1 hypothetical protein [Dongia rigui]
MKRSEIAIPSGGSRELSPDIGRLFLQQIELWTLRGDDIIRKGREVDSTFKNMPAKQRRLAHAIALSLVNLLDAEAQRVRTVKTAASAGTAAPDLA